MVYVILIIGLSLMAIMVGWWLFENWYYTRKYNKQYLKPRSQKE